MFQGTEAEIVARGGVEKVLVRAHPRPNRRAQVRLPTFDAAQRRLFR
jgi:hypothetical protein